MAEDNLLLCELETSEGQGWDWEQGGQLWGLELIQRTQKTTGERAWGQLWVNGGLAFAHQRRQQETGTESDPALSPVTHERTVSADSVVLGAASFCRGAPSWPPRPGDPAWSLLLLLRQAARFPSKVEHNLSRSSIATPGWGQTRRKAPGLGATTSPGVHPNAARTVRPPFSSPSWRGHGGSILRGIHTFRELTDVKCHVQCPAHDGF